MFDPYTTFAGVCVCVALITLCAVLIAEGET
jgi:hypothetical protein